MKENKKVEKAASVLYEMSEDEKLQRLAFLKERAIMEEQDEKEGCREDGRKEKTIEIAKKLKNKGMSMEEIMEITGLMKKEMEVL